MKKTIPTRFSTRLRTNINNSYNNKFTYKFLNKNNINKISKSPLNKYIKNINLNKELTFKNYCLSYYFVHVADIHKNFNNNKTVIKFTPIITESEWKKKQEWLYLFTIQDRIVKIGGTRNGLYGRSGSYLTGHYIEERGEKNSSSITNANIYNTLDFYVSNGYNIKMMGFKIPKLELNIDIFGKKTTIQPQTFHTYESIALESYKKQNKTIPFLSKNSDPTYRKNPRKKICN